MLHNIDIQTVFHVLHFFQINKFSPAGRLFFRYFTTEYLNKLVEICHFINDDRKTIKLQINNIHMNEVNVGRSTILQRACICSQNIDLI